jgi:hypothetical protein
LTQASTMVPTLRRRAAALAEVRLSPDRTRDQRRPQPCGRGVDLGEMPRSVSWNHCYRTCGNCAVYLGSVDFLLHRLLRPTDRHRVGVYAFTELAIFFRHPKGVQPVFERG